MAAKNTKAGSEDPRVKAMARREDGLSPLTWAEVDMIREEKLGVPLSVFLRHTGMNELRYEQAKALTVEEDPKLGGVPLWVESVLMLYTLKPPLRGLEGRLPLPFKEWGIDLRPEVRTSASTLTWAEVDYLLTDVLFVPLGVFLQHTGISRRRYQRAKKLIDSADFKHGAVPRWVEAVLLLYWVAPQFRGHYDPLPLPFEEWGIKDIEDVED